MSWLFAPARALFSRRVFHTIQAHQLPPKHRRQSQNLQQQCNNKIKHHPFLLLRKIDLSHDNRHRVVLVVATMVSAETDMIPASFAEKMLGKTRGPSICTLSPVVANLVVLRGNANRDTELVQPPCS